MDGVLNPFHLHKRLTQDDTQVDDIVEVIDPIEEPSIDDEPTEEQDP